MARRRPAVRLDIPRQGDLPVNTSPTNESGRVLVIGRSPGVLLATVDILRAKGYSADSTNQFDKVLDDYDVADLDVVVFGGMVPADMKGHLREAVSARNPDVIFVQGLAGIAGLIAAQVQAATTAGSPENGRVVYDAAQRSVRLVLDESAIVTVEAWWATSFVPPEPKSASGVVFDGRLDAGTHVVPLPDHVPPAASFAAVTVGSSVRVFTVGPMPDAVTRLAPASAADDRLPPVGRVTTGGDDR
ncbi:hypothetical protein [Actinomadura nitritigenes]|uniref:hypothetical protein n=1 Tax=Actinomadura nitritigenes TaxID=134602 RepID=UPI003D906659